MSEVFASIENDNENIYNLARDGKYSQVLHLLKTNDTYFCYGALLGACEGGHLNLITSLIQLGASNWNAGFLTACQHGHQNIVKYILGLATSNNIELDTELGLIHTFVKNYDILSLYIYNFMIENNIVIDWDDIFENLSKIKINTSIINILNELSDDILILGLINMSQNINSDIEILVHMIKNIKGNIPYEEIIRTANIDIAYFLIKNFDLKMSQEILNDKVYSCEDNDKEIALSFIQLGASIHFCFVTLNFDDYYDLYYYRGVNNLDSYEGKYIDTDNVSYGCDNRHKNNVLSCIKYHNSCVDVINNEIINVKDVTKIIMSF